MLDGLDLGVPDHKAGQLGTNVREPRKVAENYKSSGAHKNVKKNGEIKEDRGYKLKH